jgi:hypothetical protein
MTRKLPTLASLLLGAASAPAVVRPLHPWSPLALCHQAGMVSPPLMCGRMCAPLSSTLSIHAA